MSQRGKRKAPKSSNTKKKARPTHGQDEEDDEEIDTVAVLKSLKAEVLELRCLYAQSITLSETQGRQLKSQQTTISDLLDRSPATGVNPRMIVSEENPEAKHAAIFLNNWAAKNSNWKVL